MTSFASSFREIVLLTRAREKVAARPVEEHENLRRFWLAARARLRIAQRLDPRTEAVAAIPLYREGLVALVGAAIVAVEGSVASDDLTDFESAWRALDRVWPKLDLGALSSFEIARDALTHRGAIDEAPPSNAKAVCEALDQLVSLIERRIEPRTRGELRRRQIARATLVTVVPLVAIVWLVAPLFHEKSIAEHKPVKLSSPYPDSMAPLTGEDLVNGRIERTYGAHTSAEDNPWMMVDLEQPTPVKRIVVYNRGDGWFTDAIPLVAEVGVDNASMHQIARRDTVFTQHDPWVIHLDEPVRLIRLTKKGHTTLALAEVSVYSR